VIQWRSEPLGPEHEVDGFDCGVPILNQWLSRHALRYHEGDLARTYVWTAPDDRRVAAYYSINPVQLSRRHVTDLDAAGAGMIPGYELARLALDRRLHGQGLGSEVLVDALETIVRAADLAGGRLIVAGAISDNTAAFYRQHDFVPVSDNPHRLVMKVSTARKALILAESGSSEQTPTAYSVP
jgi:GNAT superfamily N-acetyltransferase